MKAWRVNRLGEPLDVMNMVDLPVPEPAPNQVVVRVLGAPANFPDALLCRGLYQIKPAIPFTPGIEVCGEVVATGPAATQHRVGDRIIGMTVLPHGAFAEFAVLDERAAFPAPPELDHAEAASLYVGYQTGWFALHRRASLQAGQTLLVHAAAGGVGSAAVQLGKAAGARVIAVVGRPEKAAVAREMGADVVVDRRIEDFVDVVNRETDGRGADIIYDPVGGETYAKSTKCVAFEGSILVIGFAGGDIQSAALNHVLIKNYSIVGLHWGLYAHHDPSRLAECHEALRELVRKGAIRPLVSERLSFDGLAEGVQRLANGHTVGRVVLQS